MRHWQNIFKNKYPRHHLIQLVFKWIQNMVRTDPRGDRVRWECVLGAKRHQIPSTSYMWLCQYLYILFFLMLYSCIFLSFLTFMRKMKKALWISDRTYFLFWRTFCIISTFVYIVKGAFIHARVPRSSKLFLRRPLKATASKALVVRNVLKYAHC